MIFENLWTSLDGCQTCRLGAVCEVPGSARSEAPWALCGPMAAVFPKATWELVCGAVSPAPRQAWVNYHLGIWDLRKLGQL